MGRFQKAFSGSLIIHDGMVFDRISGRRIEQGALATVAMMLLLHLGSGNGTVQDVGHIVDFTQIDNGKTLVTIEDSRGYSGTVTLNSVGASDLAVGMEVASVADGKKGAEVVPDNDPQDPLGSMKCPTLCRAFIRSD